MSEIRNKVLQEIQSKKQTNKLWFIFGHIFLALVFLCLWLLAVWILKELIQDSILLWDTYHNFDKFSSILFSQFLYEILGLIIILLILILVCYQKTDFPLARQNLLNLLGFFLISSFFTALILLLLLPSRTPLREGLEYRRAGGLNSELYRGQSRPVRGKVLTIEQRAGIWVYTIENPFTRNDLYSREDLGLEVGKTYEFKVEIENGDMYIVEYKNFKLEPRSRIPRRLQR